MLFLTYLQLQEIALQRSLTRRAQFVAEIMDYSPENLIFVDETGSVSE